MLHVLLFLYASKTTLFIALGLLYPAISSFLELSPTSRKNKKEPWGSRAGGEPPGMHIHFARCPASQLAVFCCITSSDDTANVIWQEGHGPDGRAASGHLPNPSFADSLRSFGASERNQGTKMGQFPEGKKRVGHYTFVNCFQSSILIFNLFYSGHRAEVSLASPVL